MNNDTTSYRHNINHCDWCFSNREYCTKKPVEKVGDAWYCASHACFAKMILDREQQKAAHEAPRP